MQKFKFPFYLIITIILTFGLTVSLQSLLAAWQAPTSAPPGGNRPVPIYSGTSTSQVIKHPLILYSPSEMLELYDNNPFYTARFRITDIENNAEIQLQDNSSHWSIYNANDDSKRLKIWYGDNRMTIDTAGNVGIGIDESTSYKLNVGGTINASGGNSGQWNTAYSERRQWDGSNTNLNADAGRGALLLGSMATQWSDGVNISGGNITGLTSLSLGATGNLTIPNGAVAGHVLKSTNSSGLATWQAESDPQIRNLTSGNWCTTDGSYVDCTTAPPSFSEVDGIIGNEVLNVTNSTLTRSGAGTAATPWTLGLNLGNANSWTNEQTFSSINLGGVSRSTWPATGITSEVDGIIGNEVTNATNLTLIRSGAGTAATPWTLGLNLGNANSWTAGQTFSSITLGGVSRSTWPAGITSEVDGIIGNEVTNAYNSTLSRYGSGTAADPYRLSVNLGNANSWTAGQTFSSITLGGVSRSTWPADSSHNTVYQVSTTGATINAHEARQVLSASINFQGGRKAQIIYSIKLYNGRIAGSYNDCGTWFHHNGNWVFDAEAYGTVSGQAYMTLVGHYFINSTTAGTNTFIVSATSQQNNTQFSRGNITIIEF